MIVLKCTQERFEALHKLFKSLVDGKPMEVNQVVNQELLMPIYNKMDKRIKVRLNGNKGWNLSINTQLAAGYYSVFKGTYLGANLQYEAIIIERHLQIIEREFSTLLTVKK